MFNDAEEAFIIENYEYVYKTLKNIDTSIPRLLLMLGISCFFTGRFHESYKRFSNILNLNSIEQNDTIPSDKIIFTTGKWLFRLLERMNIYELKLPYISDELIIQSIERANESYEEFDQFKIIMLQSGTTAGEKKISEFLDNLKLNLRSSNPYKTASANFNVAQYLNSRGKDEESIDYYISAIIADPNKALYYGYIAQLLMKLNKPNYIAATYSRRALDLDPENARWHLIHGIACNNLGRNFYKSFLKTSMFEFQLALSYCRPEQVALRKTIEQTINKLNQ